MKTNNRTYLMTLFAFMAVAVVGFLQLTTFNGAANVSAQESEDLNVNRATPEMIAYALTYKTDDLAVRHNLINQLPCTELRSADLGGKTLGAGVYCLSSAKLAGELVLDGAGDMNSAFIFRVAGGLTTTEGASVSLINKGQAANVYFVAESANVGENNSFRGNILATNAINVGSGSTIKGRLLSVNSEVSSREDAAQGGGTGTLEICKTTVDGSSTAFNNRVFRFTISGVDRVIEVPVGSCSGPIDVPVGMATITELNSGGFINSSGTFTGNFQLQQVDTISPNSNSSLGFVNFAARTAQVTIGEGGVTQELILRFVNRFAITGFVEICKRAATGPGGFNTAGDPDIIGASATGTFFTFTVAGVFVSGSNTVLQQFTAPVGFCTPPIAVTIGIPVPGGTPLSSTVNIRELPLTGFFLESVDTNPTGRVNSVTFDSLGGGTANVTVFEGGAASETLVNFRNRSNAGIIKVCKVAGPGIPLNTLFRFSVTAPFGALRNPGTGGSSAPLQGPFGPVGPITVDVLAGSPASGGTCQFVPGVGGSGNTAGLQTFAIGTPVTVQEIGVSPLNTTTLPSGQVRVAGINISQSAAPFGSFSAGSLNPGIVGGVAGLGFGTFQARRDVVVVQFVNFIFNPTQLKVCKVAGAGVAVGTPFTFDVALVNPTGINANGTSGSPLFPGFTTAVTVAAGSAAQGGNCVLLDGTNSGVVGGLLGGAFSIGSTITITERTTTPATTVSAISSGTSTITNNLTGRSTTISGTSGLVAGINSVTFVNTATTPVPPVGNRTAFDFDGDGKADLSTFTATNGTWNLQRSSAGSATVQFGNSTDKIVPADFDGDGKTDIAVYRASTGTWYIQGSTAGFSAIQFGQNGDVAQPGDFDGDGRADVAVFRPSNGIWYIMGSTSGFTGLQFGNSSDRPVVGDYDGDGRSDAAVFRSTNGVWYIMGSTSGFNAIQFGNSSDVAVPADYDGDRKTDVAVYRGGTWYIQGSTSGFNTIQFGIATDRPVPADYNGDRKADIGVYRNGMWYILDGPTDGQSRAVQFGTGNDLPVPASFQ